MTIFADCQTMQTEEHFKYGLSMGVLLMKEIYELPELQVKKSGAEPTIKYREQSDRYFYSEYLSLLFYQLSRRNFCMKMNLNEMKTLYTFGCPNREATVERLRYVSCSYS